MPITEKLLEATVKNQLVQYLENNKILTDIQSGFRKGHSCETSLNFVIANWKATINNIKVIVPVFLGFKRAFETIDRNIFISKLKSYGIIGTEANWFKSYLQDRRQPTFYGTAACSPPLLNMHGVPQGSVLGPLLFVLYINDTSSTVKHGSLNLFADDTLLTVGTDNVDNAIDKVNEDWNAYTGWSDLRCISTKG